VSGDGSQVLVAAGNDAAIASFTRDATTGALTHRGCLSGETDTGPAGTDACSQTPTAATGAVDSGLRGLRDLELAADGMSFYVAAQFDGAVTAFDRSPDGTFRFDSCFTGRLGSACNPIPGATVSGAASGLADPETVALAADGSSLYASVEADAALARFAREPLVAPPAPDTIAPETTLTDRPRANTKKRRARFSFIYTESGSRLICSIDGEAFSACTSPTTTRKLRRRRHTFEVSAVDVAGNADETPAIARWKVRRKKRGR
jgi:hypothetical protein